MKQFDQKVKEAVKDLNSAKETLAHRKAKERRERDRLAALNRANEPKEMKEQSQTERTEPDMVQVMKAVRDKPTR